MDHTKLLDVLTSLPVSQSILPRAVCFAMSRPANHAICSFIDSSGYSSEPIRICLFIDYIIICFTGILSVLIWVQAVCKGYQLMTKVTNSKDRALKRSNMVPRDNIQACS